MWQFVSKFILRFRVALLVVLLSFTAFMGYKGTGIQMKYEFPRMLPNNDVVAVEYDAFREMFGEDGSLLVLGVRDSSFFTLNKFNDWISLTERMKQVQGVTGIATVSNVIEIVKDTAERKFYSHKVFPDKVETQVQLDSLKNRFKALEFYKGILYNDTSNMYLMAVTFQESKLNSKARFAIVDSLQHFADEFGAKYDVKIHYSGLPYTRTRIAEMVEKELNMFIILAGVVTIIILFLFFRSFKAVFVSSLVVGISVLWTTGTMALLGYKITILTGMIPPLMIVIGVPNCVFLMNKFHNEFRSHGNKHDALRKIIEKIGKATFLTNLTTAAGFGTFIITQNPFLVEFGIVTSINIMGIFIISLIVVPILFSFFSEPKEKHVKHLDNKFISNLLEKVVVVILNYRNAIYTIVALFIVACIFGITLVHSTGYIIDDIPEDDPVYVDLKFFEKEIKGVMPLEISINTLTPKGVMKYATINRIHKLQKELKKYPELSAGTSIPDGLKFARQAYFNGKQEHYEFPTSQELNFILPYLTNSNEQGDLLKSFIDSTSQYTRISYRVEDVGTVRMNELRDSIKNDVLKIFPEEKYKVSITGSSVVFTEGTSYLIHNLMSSVLLAIVLIAIFMAWLSKSFRMVVVSITPNLIPLIFTAALMGFADIPIKPSTVLVFSIAFGIAVDNAIHYLTKYRLELIHTNGNVTEAVVNSTRETGVSMIYTAIILFFGFGIFQASSFGGTQAMGTLVSFTLIVALLSNLIVLPAMLLTIEKFAKTKKEEIEPFFTDEHDA